MHRRCFDPRGLGAPRRQASSDRSLRKTRRHSPERIGASRVKFATSMTCGPNWRWRILRMEGEGMVGIEM